MEEMIISCSFLCKVDVSFDATRSALIPVRFPFKAKNLKLVKASPDGGLSLCGNDYYRG